jgi:hypothetical protein
LCIILCCSHENVSRGENWSKCKSRHSVELTNDWTKKETSHFAWRLYSLKCNSATVSGEIVSWVSVWTTFKWLIAKKQLPRTNVRMVSERLSMKFSSE